MGIRTKEICRADEDQGCIFGYDAEGEELWSVNSAESLNPDDDSGQWLWTNEWDSESRWFDSKASALRHAKSHTYGGV